MTGAFDLTGRGALVTGASRGGLGYHAALALAAAGAKVVVSDHPSTSDELQETADAVRAAGGTATVQYADIADEQSVNHLVLAAAQDLNAEIDILAHHAGVMLRQPTIDTSLTEWSRVIDINLTGTFLINRAVAPAMIAKGRGKIINVSSIYVNIVGPIPEPAYYASKAGVANLSRGLAAEWGRHGVTVNCLAPGVFFPTRMTAALAENPERLEQMAQRTLLKRLGDPQTDIGGTIVWLASGASDYVTGQVIYLDGGWTAN
jgi:NAD(P)-dependent dehydrogenase (short-subunit alcohol dehydrogenase family)